MRVARRSASASHAPPPKAKRTSGHQQAILSVSDSIQTLATALVSRQTGNSSSSAANLVPATPQRRTIAIRRLAQIDQSLSVKTRTTLILIFQNDIAAADTYVALDADETELRHTWIRNLLAERHPGSSFPDLEGETA